MAAFSEFPLDEGTVRFADLVPTRSQFIGDSRVGVDLDAEFNIVEPDRTPSLPYRPVDAPSGFAVMGRRRRCAGAGSEYRCHTSEVLVAHAGHWRVSIGADGRDGSVELGVGDVMSVPAGAIRRVELLDDVDGFLFVVRGSAECDGDDLPVAGFTVSAQGDLLAVRGGQWIDDSGGVPVLRTIRTDEQPNARSTPDELAARWACPASAMQASADSAFDSTGVAVAPVIGRDAVPAACARGRHGTGGRHGFCLHLMSMESGAYVPAHRRREPFAIVLQDGTLEVRSSAEVIMLGAGDVLSMRPGLEHSLRNTTSRATRAFIVVGADDPAPPDFSSRPLAGRG